MKKTQIKELEKKITNIVESYQNLSAACQAVIDVGAMDIDGKLYDAIWKNFDLLLKLTDNEDWISWHLFDNSCGADGKKAKATEKSKLRKVETPHDLAKIIVEFEKSNKKPFVIP